MRNITEITEYQGNISYRHVYGNDTTVYMDSVVAVVPWLKSHDPDWPGINAAIESAEDLI